MRSKKALLNIIFSLVLQLTTVFSSFIIPKYIILTFGSSVNGAITSITQFLGYIVLLESGVGGVIRAALYKPLAENDNKSVDIIVSTAERFFKQIAYIFVLYLLVIALVFPQLVKEQFQYFYIFTLVLIMGIGVFVQYFFGITYSVLLQADQRQYISSIFQIYTLILNTIISVFLIKLGANVHSVMIASTVILATRPFLLYTYVKNKFKISTKSDINNNLIKQRWDGLGHHIAYFLHRSTDVAILTLFTPIKEVSVYSIYYMVAAGVSKFVNIFATGTEAAFGNMIAKGEKELLEKNFRMFEFIAFTITTIFFSSAAVLVLPFVTIYTRGVSDVNYIRPLFAYILIGAEALYCLRMPYQAVVLAAGHYKQTRKGAYIEASLNIMLSIVGVQLWGMTGVAAATLISMLFRTIQYVTYLSKNILERSIKLAFKRTIVNLISAVIIILVTKIIPSSDPNSYFDLFLVALLVVVLASIISLILNLVFYFEDVKGLFDKIKFLTKNKIG